MANEKRLIDANALKAKAFHTDTICEDLAVWVEDIDEAPTVDAVEVVHGRWEKVYTCHGERLWAYGCDRCKAENGKKSNYCPNCGADMRGETE